MNTFTYTMSCYNEMLQIVRVIPFRESSVRIIICDKLAGIVYIAQALKSYYQFPARLNIVQFFHQLMKRSGCDEFQPAVSRHAV